MTFNVGFDQIIFLEIIAEDNLKKLKNVWIVIQKYPNTT